MQDGSYRLCVRLAESNRSGRLAGPWNKRAPAANPPCGVIYCVG